jgi:hypothetical protein
MATRRSQRAPDPLPLGQSSRRWIIEVWEIQDNGSGHTLTCAGVIPDGRIPAQWRAAWWMSLARWAHAMALGAEQEAREQKPRAD